jgi:3-methyladenine DNA glycosylase/8-oxoguanine DNA glycosylase
VYLARAVRHMLRLDEDFSEFYDHCKLKGGTWGEIRIGTGHLLRSPTVFEDLVKVICTTNIQWSGTKRMVRELVREAIFS